MKLKVCQETTCAATQTDRPKQPPLVLWRRVSMSQQASAQAPRLAPWGYLFRIPAPNLMGVGFVDDPGVARILRIDVLA